jgi:hypothetical protein
MIPPGPHFVFYSSAGKHEARSQPFFTGFFIHPGPADVVVRRWDPGSEMLVKLPDEDEEERYRIGVRKLEFDKSLGAYDLQNYTAWKRISGHVTVEAIGRFEPLHGDISVIHEAEFADSQARTPAEKRLQRCLEESRRSLETRMRRSDRRREHSTDGASTEEEKDLTIGNGRVRDAVMAEQIAIAADGSKNMHSIVETADADGSKCMHSRVESVDVGGSKNMQSTAESMDVDDDGKSMHSKAESTDADLTRKPESMDVVDSLENASKLSREMHSDVGKEPSGRCFYTKLPHLVKRSGLGASQLTMLNVDKSSELERLLAEQYHGSEDLLLGELEFSFIAFLMGQSLESFSQWKSIVCLMLSCDEAPLSRRTRLFVKFLGIVCAQLMVGLKPSPDADAEIAILDSTWFSDDNFLKVAFKEFYRLIAETRPIDGDLLKHTRHLKSILEKFLGWTFGLVEGEDDDDDEYAPVVVAESDL